MKGMKGIKISFKIMKEGSKYAYKNIQVGRRGGGWTKANGKQYLNSLCICGHEQEKILGKAYKNYKLKRVNNLVPIKPIWLGKRELCWFTDAIMHMVFLGIVSSTIDQNRKSLKDMSNPKMLAIFME